MSSADTFKVPLPMAPPPPPQKDKEEQEEEEKESSSFPTPPAPPPSSVSREPPLKYADPPWSGLPPPGFSLEVVKGGAVVQTLPLQGRSRFVMGRLPSCQLRLEHPSLSRQHALIQYRDRQGGGRGEDDGKK